MWQEQIQPKQAGKILRTFALLQDALLARSGLTAYLPITIVTIFMFFGASWQVFWTTTDPARYQCYALTFWLGSSATNLLPSSQCSFLSISAAQPAFHMLPLEYPPLTLLPFSLALLAPLSYYQLAFALLMSLTSVLIYWLLLLYGPRGAALAFAFYVFIGAIATAQGRFDLIPAALTLLCIIAAERKHWTAAYVALAFGVLLKIYPILLLPALFIAEQRATGHLYKLPRILSLMLVPQYVWSALRGAPRWHWKNCLIFLGIVLGITGIFALLDFQGAVINQLSYFAHRPIQVEATGSTFLWLARGAGVPLQIAYTYGSLNIISGLDGVVSFVSMVCFVLGYIYTLWIQWRGKLDVTQVSIALLLIFIVTGKVFSPQYLIWLMPLLAYAGAFDGFWLCIWGTISLLTTYIYAYLYSRPVDPLYVPYVPGFFQSVMMRNTFFILITLAYLFNWFQVRQRKPLQTAPAPAQTEEAMITSLV